MRITSRHPASMMEAVHLREATVEGVTVSEGKLVVSARRKGDRELWNIEMTPDDVGLMIGAMENRMPGPQPANDAPAPIAVDFPDSENPDVRLTADTMAAIGFDPWMQP